MSKHASIAAKLCFAWTLSLVLAYPVFALSLNDVWINEFHYDNNGGDTGEFVELAAKATADLTGLQVTLYNGSNQLEYASVGLTGADIDSIVDGIRYIVFEIAGIQNGPPDGLSLSGPGLLQFLSYEGSFTAIDGPAAGISSTDVGVLENSSTPVGHSLQLTGSGMAYNDFSWSGPAGNTKGYANAGQSFGVPDNGTSFSLFSLGLITLVLLKRRKA